MIHGLTGTPWVFQELKELLESKGITIFAPFLPGHGTTPEDLNRVTWKDWTGSTKKAYNELQSRCDAVFILGLSMGGAVALYLASEVPCRGIISLSAPIRFHGLWVWTLPIMRIFIRYWRKGSRSLNSESPEEEIGYDCYPLSALSQMIQMLREVRARLKEVRCPALIMHSKGDIRVSVQNANAINVGIGSTAKQMILLDYPCHVVTKGEDYRQVAEAVFRFIRENAREA
jgi:carboxylesterase